MHFTTLTSQRPNCSQYARCSLAKASRSEESREYRPQLCRLLSHRTRDSRTLHFTFWVDDLLEVDVSACHYARPNLPLPVSKSRDTNLALVPSSSRERFAQAIRLPRSLEAQNPCKGDHSPHQHCPRSTGKPHPPSSTAYFALPPQPA